MTSKGVSKATVYNIRENHGSMKIQLNRNGAWKDLIAFDRDEAEGGNALQAAHDLVKACYPKSTRVTMRLVLTAMATELVLARWAPDTGWLFPHEPGGEAGKPLPNPPKSEIGATGAAGADRSPEARKATP